MRFPHMVDVHFYSESESASGQVVPDYCFSRTINAHVAPVGTVRKTAPYVTENAEYGVHIPRHFEDKITYDSRLYNIRDSHGNVLEAGPLEIVSIVKRPGYSGRLNHLHVKARVVVESK